MKEYKVIASICYSGKTQNIHTAGEIVTTDHFNEGEAEKHVVGGFLKVYDSAEIVTESKKNKAAKV